MKHIFTISLCFLALSLSAQTDGWKYPFPYNPDGNADGYISLDDMLDLLAVYGQQYPESFYTDTTRAVLNLGEMGAPSCLLKAKAAGRDWRMMSDIDIPYFAQLAVNVFTINPENDVTTHYVWTWDTNDNRPTRSSWELIMSNGNNCPYYNDCIYKTDSTIYLNNLFLEDNFGELLYRSECFIVTEVRPDIDYYIAFGSLSQVEEEVNDSLSNGWNLIGGFSNNSSSSCSQAIWRWAE